MIVMRRNFPEMRGRAVEFDQTLLRLAVNHVSLKAFAVAQVATRISRIRAAQPAQPDRTETVRLPS